MPWKVLRVSDQREHFMRDWLSGDYSKAVLCRRYGISRPTGYKWIDRFEREGMTGLTDRSCAPHSHPCAVPVERVAKIIETKLAYPDFGPKKVMDWLRRRYPSERWPANSTAGEILYRAELVRPRVRRHRVAAYSEPFLSCHGPNVNWSADFKGDFELGNGQRCYPLTLSDNYSRYMLLCRALTRTPYSVVQPWFEWAFREYGLPEAIRTDNGPPFASVALGGLTRLSVFLIRLGIRPERIVPGRPDQNGRHERMHRSLSSGVFPIQQTPLAQQEKFNRWVQIFNWERSHESIGRQLPGSFYQTSPRPYPPRLPQVEYKSDVVVRQVRHNGEIKWRGERLYITETLKQQPVSLRQITEERWEIRYSFHLLGYWNERTNLIEKPRQWHGKLKP